MAETGDRMDRARRYVFGLMNDEERERAERDLEIDPAFGDAMVEIAERMHLFDRMPAAGEMPQDHWRVVKENIDAMPQMRPVAVAKPRQPDPEAATPNVSFGRRRSDRLRASIARETAPKTVGMSLHAVAGRRALALALCLILAFALGYVVGRL